MKFCYFQSIDLIWFRFHFILEDQKFSFLHLNLVHHCLIQIQKINQDYYNHPVDRHQKYYGLDRYLEY